ncbi:protein kinase domain-containing protein [Micromonospora fulviviridis]|uniref:non-specific serine/threonine protein kinase n=1 Tax=Micromonospora fulviviridis TaxID=47860 RepID=A0ABV2VN11_9ACTN
MTVPTRIGAYRVERLLGAGSFATVWLAYDPVLDGRVAIKVLAENWSHDLRVRERFLEEARLLRRLDHDRLVRVHAVGELPDGRPYAVLAWADGGSLRDRLARGPLPGAEAVTLLDEIAAGVAVLHRHGVVHRDLTPGNILFRSGPGAERVLIADLGLAKALAAASGLTARAGTPGYMAPEQDDPLAVVDTRADVFGLGRLGLRLLGDAAVPAGVREDWPAGRAQPRLRVGVPPGLAAVLRTATAARPAAIRTRRRSGRPSGAPRRPPPGPPATPRGRPAGGGSPPRGRSRWCSSPWPPPRATRPTAARPAPWGAAGRSPSSCRPAGGPTAPAGPGSTATTASWNRRWWYPRTRAAGGWARACPAPSSVSPPARPAAPPRRASSPNARTRTAQRRRCGVPGRAASTGWSPHSPAPAAGR